MTNTLLRQIGFEPFARKFSAPISAKNLEVIAGVSKNVVIDILKTPKSVCLFCNTENVAVAREIIFE